MPRQPMFPISSRVQFQKKDSLVRRAEVCESFYKTTKGNVPIWGKGDKNEKADSNTNNPFCDIVYRLQWLEGNQLKTAVVSEQAMGFSF